MSTVTPTPVADSTLEAVRIPASTTTVSEMQTLNEMRIPIGCHFSSISPNLDRVIYTCGNKLWLAKTTHPSNAIFIIQDDNLVATSWSPNGSEITMGTYHLDQGNNYIASLWVFKQDTPSEKKLLYQGSFFCDVQLWSPNGKWILATGGSGKSGAATFIRTDGTGRQDTRTPIGIMEWWHGASWSPDGARLAYASDEHLGEIRVLNMNDETTTLFYTRTKSIPVPAWSPDGKAIAVLVQSWPDELVLLESPTKRALSRPELPSRWRDAYDLFWSPTNDRIALSLDPFGRHIGVVSLSGGEPFEYADEKSSNLLGWTRDGKSLIILDQEGDQETVRIIFVK